MKTFAKYIFVAAGITAFMMVVAPSVEAALTTQEQTQVASLLSSLDSISALLNQFKNKLLGTASAQISIPEPALNAQCLSPQSWGTPHPLSGTVYSFPAMESLSDGALVIMAQGGDNNIYVKEWKDGTIIKDWYFVNGQTLGSPKLVKISGELWAYVRGTDGVIYKNRFVGTGEGVARWSGWMGIGEPNSSFGTPGPHAVQNTLGIFDFGTLSFPGPVSVRKCGGGGTTLSCTPPATISPEEGATVTASSDSKITVSWAHVSGATSYNIRLDDQTDSSFDTDLAKQQHLTNTGGSVKCPNSPHYICENVVPSSITQIPNVPVVRGHNYRFWVDPIGPWTDYCNKGSTFTVAPISITNTPPFGFIDIPAGSATVSGTVTVEGWVADKEGPIATGDIKLRVDSTDLTITPTRVTRTDVCDNASVLTQLGLANDQNGKNLCNAKQPLGIQFIWNTSSLSNGSHNIGFVVNDSGSFTVIGARTVTVSGGVIDNTPPATITNLTALNLTGLVAGTNQATLTWAAPGEDGPGSTGIASSYDIRFSLTNNLTTNWSSAASAVTLHASNGITFPATPGVGQNMTVAGLSPNTIYYFAIKTKDEANNESALSNVASLTTLTGGAFDFSLTLASSASVAQGSFFPLSVSVNSSLTAASQAVTITASNLPNGVSANSTSCTPSPSCTVGLTLTTLSNAPLVTNHSITITGTAGSVVHSGPVNLSVTSTGGGDSINPSVPTGLTAAPFSDSQISLNWNAATDNVGVTGYLVHVFRNLPEINVIGPFTVTSHIVGGLSPGTTYSFAVEARDAAANSSGLSGQVTATTLNTGGGGDDGSIAKMLQDGDPIVVVNTEKLKVRSAPSPTASPAGQSQNGGAKGTIRCSSRDINLHQHCPLIQDGIVWWYVDYLAGADGWSAERRADPLTEKIDVLLEKELTPGAGFFQLNDRVEVTSAGSPLIIRSAPIRVDSNIKGLAPVGKKGIILPAPSGFSYPHRADTHTWWFIRWDDVSNCFGNACDGWSAEGPESNRFLIKIGAGGGGGGATFRISPSKINSYFYWSAQGDSYQEDSYTYALYDSDGPTGPEPERRLFPSEVAWTPGDPRLNLSNQPQRSGRWLAYAGTLNQYGFPENMQPYVTTITASYKGMTASIPFTMNVGRRPGSERSYQWVLSPGKFFSGLPYVPYDNNAINSVSDPLAKGANFEMTVKVGETKTYPISVATGFENDLEELSGITNLLGTLLFTCNYVGPGGVTCDNRYRITGVAEGRTYIYHSGTFNTAELTVTRVTVTP